ncbi:M15 family metallopeptidase [Polaribacter sp. 11A2H]|uniref:M15 family metallopeptidase n=1 Tax=Polaribacter sp. 11A2H TaxID=2687290 RepID=UPI001409D9CF|nr:M15 family metallopeptidase [Polaribacter sp. 11A2H]
MGIYKVPLKLIGILFLFGCFNGCKPTPKKIAIQTTEVVEEKKSIPIYPKYLNTNYVLGKFNYTENSDFTTVPKENSSKKIYLRKDVLEAFLQMNNAALKEDISFTILSGTRNFNHQKRIWDYKWNDKYKSLPPLDRAKKILEFSSMPSTSRHHWGTDIDINSLNNAYFGNGKGLKEYNWLLQNAHIFGFYQVYTSKENGRTGYSEEKWHWTYLPLSSLYLTYYNATVRLENINGFEGYSYAKELNVVKEYVNGINSKILEKQ